MRYRQLGNSGVKVSVIGMGTNQFGGKVDQTGVTNIISEAIDLGINFIDTADMYQQGRSEETLGVALNGKRDKVILATKVFFPSGDGPNDGGTSRHHILQGVEASLRRLQTDYIDLYQMHRWDENTPIEETMRTLNDLVTSGKVRYIGSSNYLSWQLAKANLLAEFRGWVPMVTEQGHYHMLEREVEKEMLPYCRAHNVGFLPFFPLAGGFLTGKYRRGESAPAGSRGEKSQYVQDLMTDANFSIIEQLSAWAEGQGRSLNELAHAWLLAQPQVSSVISGLTKPEHLRSNAAAGDWDLSAENLAQINTLLDPQSPS